MITLDTNVSNLVARIVTTILAGVMIYLIIYHGLVNKEIRPLFLLYFLICIMLFLLITLVISFFGIIKVTVDKTSDLLTLQGLFGEKIISKNNITGYYNLFSMSRHRIFYGLILVLNNNQTIELSEFNLKTIAGVEEYLHEINIQCLGRKKTWFPFKRRL